MEGLAGMAKMLSFGGSFWNFTIDEFVQNAVELYTNEALWKLNLENGTKIMSKRMAYQRNQYLLHMKLLHY